MNCVLTLIFYQLCIWMGSEFRKKSELPFCITTSVMFPVLGGWATVSLPSVFLSHCGGMNFQKTGMMKVS